MQFKSFIEHHNEFLALFLKPDENGKYRFIQSGKDGIVEDVLVDDLVEGFDKLIELKNDLGYKMFSGDPNGVLALHPEVY